MSSILVIDDEEIIRQLLRRALERAGHTVRVARNGREALRLFDEAEPDCVITDLAMPEQEGIETILQIRRRSRRVAIIAMSGHLNLLAADCLNVARKLGANAAVVKPFGLEEFLSLVEKLLNLLPLAA